RHHLFAGGHGRHDHRRGRPPGGGRAADSRPLHAPRQRLHRRHDRGPALLPLLFHGPPPTQDRRARRV
ncbi:MAG: hypothetical protein AVDCRST_MAG05-3674, partial [uncultured Rubrobacteraceae bacterium]